MIRFKEIRYKNFLSSGNQFTSIKLDENKDTLIVGANGSGKSTVLDALTFSLFGKPFRKVTKGQLVNSTNERDAVVDIRFDIGDVPYRVIRGIKPNIFEIYKNGKNSMRTALLTINKSLWKDKYSNSTTSLSPKLLYLGVLLSFPLCNYLLHIAGKL